MGKPWFHHKRFGYGAGLPCSWEGWLLLLGYLAADVGVSLALFDTRPGIAGGILAGLTVLLVVIVVAKTRGGWRWRWGQGE